MNELEFDVREIQSAEKCIIYSIERMGLRVGIMMLTTPYHKEEAKCLRMIMKKI